MHCNTCVHDDEAANTFPTSIAMFTEYFNLYNIFSQNKIKQFSGWPKRCFGQLHSIRRRCRWEEPQWINFQKYIKYSSDTSNIFLFKLIFGGEITDESARSCPPMKIRGRTVAEVYVVVASCMDRKGFQKSPRTHKLRQSLPHPSRLELRTCCWPAPQRVAALQCKQARLVCCTRYIGYMYSNQCFWVSKLNVLFSGYFDPENVCLHDKNKWFSGWPNRYFG